MKYLCAVYLEPNALQGLSAGEQAKLNRDSLDYNGASAELQKQLLDLSRNRNWWNYRGVLLRTERTA